MNALLEGLKKKENLTTTENGAVVYRSTLDKCLDMFALGGAMRDRAESDMYKLFVDAYNENPLVAMKLLFYMRDVRGGQGERRFFKILVRRLAYVIPEIIKKNMHLIPEYGRWDDLYILVDNTPLMHDALEFMHVQFVLDMNSKTPSLLGKWLKSENTSSVASRRLASMTRKYFKLNPKQYRQSLSLLRGRIKIVETLMSQNKWDQIEFDKLPSKAGIKYRNAFARRDMLKARYETFALSEETKVNAKALYPYDVIHNVFKQIQTSWYSGFEREIDEVQRAILNKYWENLTDYFEGKQLNALCMVDTSSSMWGTAMEVAISLGIYCAERAGGPFKNHYMTFSSKPTLVELKGKDFVENVTDIYDNCIIENTNIEAAFDLMLKTAVENKLTQEELPDHLVIISDMQFDAATRYSSKFKQDNANILFELIEKDYQRHGYKIPKLIFWNVDARENTIPMLGRNVSYVSGFSPVIFESVMSMKTGKELMLEAINKERYNAVTI